MFFDFEGDPWWGDEGLEYLFGTVYREDGEWRYWPLWAETRAEEKARFEQWMDWITARLAAHPDLHIFHFNSYEPVAIKRLMSRHATREHEVDELLRRKVFVDLYGVVRQAMRVGTESYGLKALEPVFGFKRDASLREAIGSLRRWQAYLEAGDRAAARRDRRLQRRRLPLDPRAARLADGAPHRGRGRVRRRRSTGSSPSRPSR